MTWARDVHHQLHSDNGGNIWKDQGVEHAIIGNLLQCSLMKGEGDSRPDGSSAEKTDNLCQSHTNNQYSASKTMGSAKAKKHRTTTTFLSGPKPESVSGNSATIDLTRTPTPELDRALEIAGTGDEGLSEGVRYTNEGL